MNRFPITVNGETPVSRAYNIFLLMGLRHLCVVDRYNQVIGLVTRKDLDVASGNIKLSHIVCQRLLK